MASEEQLLKLRRLIADAKPNCTYSDQTLKDLIDGEPNLNKLASQIWIEKAASFSTMVDVSESGSSRKMSDLHDNALAQAKFFKTLVDDATTPAAETPYPFTVQAERP